ncbi:uncharacterized protein NPIL_494971 [Nephila pilipes]|uniref:Integrase catalytic domain-containing protein n=1 Tax=Nephila pilipes TaxID=299642 RepID=A0A8X6U0S6_NEPPI|nr:uncharacterized protein NPIL_494971 [Nephila pilipes]
MKKDSQLWTRACLSCQWSKVHRHTQSVPGEFKIPPHRCQHLNIDLVGPLQIGKGFKYLVTIKDRLTRWIEAVLLEDQSAESIAKALIKTWFHASEFRVA